MIAPAPLLNDPSLLPVLEDPVKFSRLVWPDMRLYDKQEEILYSVRDNVETFVHAANEVGKDFITARAVIWFFCSRRPVRVITSSSGETQLKSILWSEIRHGIATSKVKLPIKLGSLLLKWVLPTGGECDLSYMLGHVTNSIENFHGHHLPHDKPRVMAVFDEASGVADEFNEAADSWCHRKLVIGNPMNTTNFFFRCCKRGDIEHDDDMQHLGGKLRKVIHIGAKDSPNVQLGRKLAKAKVPGPYPSVIPGVLSYPEYKRRLKIWDRIRKVMRLDGHFYEGDETLCFPPDWLDGAEREYERLAPGGYESTALKLPRTLAPVSMGVDTGAGRDLTVWTMISPLGIARQIAAQTPDTSVIVDRTIKYLNQYDVRPEKCAFDAGGGGKQIADQLRRRGYNVQVIAFGEAPTPPKSHRVRGPKAREAVAEQRVVYKNRRAEMYGLARELIDPAINERVFALPVELFELRKELAIMPVYYDEESRMFLPPKDKTPSLTGRENKVEPITIKKLLGRSPDRADSFVLAVFAWKGRPSRIKVG